MKKKTIFCIIAFIITMLLIAGRIFAKNNDCTIVVDYIDQNSKNSIQTMYMYGNEGEILNTEEKEIENYKLVEKPQKEQYTFTKEKQYVYYYYKYISQGVTIQYKDRKTNNLLEPEQHIDGLEGDPYTSDIKTFDNYEYVGSEKPYNATGKLGKWLEEVTYYYAKKIPIKVNHIFGKNGGTKTTYIVGLEDEIYSTEPIKDLKNINGTEYKLDESKMPSNRTGTVTENPKEVNYYYIPKSKGIKINYIDLATGEQLEEPIKVEGWTGDKYTLKPKEIEGYDMVKPKQTKGYDIVQKPEQETIEFTEDLTEITYYYAYKSGLTVKYIDEETEEVLKYHTFEGHEGDLIETKPEEIEYYKLTEEPENPEVKLTKEEKEITYKYKKLEFNLKVEEKIETVEINDTKKKVDKDIGKIEIPNDKEEHKIKINYKILVTNTGEISGSADLVKEIPEDFEIINISEIPRDSESISKNIQSENQQQKTDKEPVSIEESKNPESFSKISNITPGQTKEYMITISSKENIEPGEKISKTKIENLENPAQYEETTKNDNEAETKLIVGIQTGTKHEIKNIIIIIIAIILIITIIILKLLFKRK